MPAQTEHDQKWDGVKEQLLRARQQAERGGWGPVEELLLARCLAGTCDEADRSRVEEILARFPRLRECVAVLESVYPAEAGAVAWTEEPIEYPGRILLPFARAARAAIQRMIERLQPYLLPMTGGEGEEFDLRTVSGMFATAVGVRTTLSWRPAGFDHEDRPFVLCGSAGAERPAADAVTFKDGFVVVRSDLIPADGRWWLFVLSGTEDPTSALRVEGFALRGEPAAPAAGSLAPAELLERGFVCEAWQGAIDEGWSESELAQLLLLACAKMHALLDEFASQVTRDQFHEGLFEVQANLFYRAREELDGRKDRLFELLRTFAPGEEPPA